MASSHARLQLSVSLSPEQILRTAIKTGVPKYNKGDYNGCYQDFLAAVAQLNTFLDKRSPHYKPVLKAKQEAKLFWQNGRYSSACWRIREAFDDILEADPLKECTRLVVRATRKGSSRYNRGNYVGCYKLYKKRTQQMIALLRPKYKEESKKFIDGLAKAQTQSAKEASWTLRNAFDNFYKRAVKKQIKTSMELRKERVGTKGKKGDKKDSKDEATKKSATEHAKDLKKVLVKINEMDVQFPPEFYDPITLELMQDPVVTCDGHSYDKTSIKKWLETNDTSPITGLKLKNKNTIPNHNLRSQIQSMTLNALRASARHQVRNPRTKSPRKNTNKPKGEKSDMPAKSSGDYTDLLGSEPFEVYKPVAVTGPATSKKEAGHERTNTGVNDRFLSSSSSDDADFNPFGTQYTNPFAAALPTGTNSSVDSTLNPQEDLLEL